MKRSTPSCRPWRVYPILRPDYRLQIECQPLLGSARHVVQVEPDGPEKFPRTPTVPRLLLRKDPAEIGKFAHCLSIENITRDPIQRLQIAQAAAAFLDIRFDDKWAVAISPMANCSFSLLRCDILGGAGLFAGSPKTAMEFPKQCFVTSQKPRIEQGGPNRRILAPSSRQSPIERVAWPTFSPRSQRKYNMYSTTRSVSAVGSSAVRNNRSISLNGARYPPSVAARCSYAEVFDESQFGFAGGMFEQRRNNPVDQRAKQPRSL